MDREDRRLWERSGIVVDESCWPVLVERMPIVFPSDDSTIDAWIAHVDSLMARRKSEFVMIVDGLATKKPASAHARRRMAEWLSTSPDYQRYCLDTVFIVSSPLVRGTLTVINWLSRSHPPRTIVGTWDEALDLAERSLERSTVRMPIDIQIRLRTTA